MAHKSDAFDEFYKEKKDSVLTSKQQIDRLLRPGSLYFNLNPFAVLDVEPEVSIEEIKKKYRKLSILIHPDKNQSDSERAKQAFDALNKAWKLLDDPLNRENCYSVVEQAKMKVLDYMEQKKRELAREGKSIVIDEDDPDKFKKAVYVYTTKIFADLERKRQQLERREMEERKRQGEIVLSEEEIRKYQEEWKKNFDDTREFRIESWLKFKKKIPETATAISITSGNAPPRPENIIMAPPSNAHNIPIPDAFSANSTRFTDNLVRGFGQNYTSAKNSDSKSKLNNSNSLGLGLALDTVPLPDETPPPQIQPQTPVIINPDPSKRKITETLVSDTNLIGNCYAVFGDAVTGNEKKKKKFIRTFKPPKHKAESR